MILIEYFFGFFLHTTYSVIRLQLSCGFPDLAGPAIWNAFASETSLTHSILGLGLLWITVRVISQKSRKHFSVLSHPRSLPKLLQESLTTHPRRHKKNPEQHLKHCVCDSTIRKKLGKNGFYRRVLKKTPTQEFLGNVLRTDETKVDYFLTSGYYIYVTDVRNSALLLQKWRILAH